MHTTTVLQISRSTTAFPRSDLSPSPWLPRRERSIFWSGQGHLASTVRGTGRSHPESYNRGGGGGVISGSLRVFLNLSLVRLTEARCVFLLTMVCIRQRNFRNVVTVRIKITYLDV